MLEGVPIADSLFKNHFPLAFHEADGFGNEVVGYCFGDGLLIIELRLRTNTTVMGWEITEVAKTLTST